MRKSTFLLFIAFFLLEKGFAQDNPNTLLWKISRPGLQKPSWLFGVKHNANGEALIKRYPVIAEKLSASEMLVQEIDMEEGQPAVDPSTLFYSGDTTIKDFLSGNDYETILAFITEKSGNSKEITDRLVKMKPQLLLLAMGELASEDSVNTEGENNLDGYLLELAKKDKKKSAGLENAVDRSRSVANTMNDEKAFSMILARIKNLNKNTTIQLEDGYEDLQIYYFLKKSVEDNGGVTERNAAWVAQLPALIADKSCFIAVGLDHLKAKTGLITLLRKQGYKVTPVKML